MGFLEEELEDLLVGDDFGKSASELAELCDVDSRKIGRVLSSSSRFKKVSREKWVVKDDKPLF